MVDTCRSHLEHWKDQPHRIHHSVQFEHDLDSFFEGITFLVTLNNVKLFEIRSGISINIYAYDNKYVIYPMIITDEEEANHVDFLYMKKSHFCLIRDLSGRSQLTQQ